MKTIKKRRHIARFLACILCAATALGSTVLLNNKFVNADNSEINAVLDTTLYDMTKQVFKGMGRINVVSLRHAANDLINLSALLDMSSTADGGFVVAGPTVRVTKYMIEANTTTCIEYNDEEHTSCKSYGPAYEIDEDEYPFDMLSAGSSIAKYDRDGNLEWNKVFGVLGEGMLDEENIYVILDDAKVTEQQIMESCFNPETGELLPDCIIKGKNVDLAYSVAQDANGGYVVLALEINVFGLLTGGEMNFDGESSSPFERIEDIAIDVIEGVVEANEFLKPTVIHMDAGGNVDWKFVVNNDDMKNLLMEELEEKTTLEDFEAEEGVEFLFPTEITALSDGGFALAAVGGIIAAQELRDERECYDDYYEDYYDCSEYYGVRGVVMLSSFILKIDQTGSLVKGKSYGGFFKEIDTTAMNDNEDEDDELTSLPIEIITGITEGNNGGVAISGAKIDLMLSLRELISENGIQINTGRFINGEVINFDSDFNVSWAATTENTSHRFALYKNLIHTSDGGFAAVGISTKIFPIRTLISKYSANGDLEWDYTWIDNSTEALLSIGYDIAELPNGNIAVAGMSLEDINIDLLINTIFELTVGLNETHTFEELAENYGSIFDDPTSFVRSIFNMDAYVLEFNHNTGDVEASEVLDDVDYGTIRVVGDNIVVVGIDHGNGEGDSENLGGFSSNVVVFNNDDDVRKNDDYEITVPNTGSLKALIKKQVILRAVRAISAVLFVVILGLSLISRKKKGVRR